MFLKKLLPYFIAIIFLSLILACSSSDDSNVEDGDSSDNVDLSENDNTDSTDKSENQGGDSDLDIELTDGDLEEQATDGDFEQEIEQELEVDQIGEVEIDFEAEAESDAEAEQELEAEIDFDNDLIDQISEVDIEFDAVIDGDEDLVEIDVVLGDTPMPGDLLFNELMIRTEYFAENYAQWIEMKNISGKVLNLSSCVLKISEQDNPLGNIAIEQDGFLLFGLSDSQIVNGDITPDVLLTSGMLDYQSESLLLKCGANTIDWVEYSSGWPIFSGSSMNLSREIILATDNDSSVNWCESTEDFNDYNKGTPGAINRSCLAIDGDDDSIDGEIPMPQPIGGQVVISEIMLMPDQLEVSDAQWFEIVNISDQPYTLEGCRFADDMDTNWTNINQELVIEAGEYLLFASSANQTLNGGIEPDFTWSGWSFATTPSAVRIRCGLIAVDEVYYDESWPMTAGTAMSLDPQSTNTTENNLSENWCMAVDNYEANNLGTPDAVNPSCD